MMDPVFVLSYPRCRTAWLATYLSGAGVYAFHEAWRLVSDVKGLRALMESKGPGPVVNVDCSNWFFLEELQAEFPDALYIEITRAVPDVLQSLKESYGDHDYTAMLASYDRAMQRSEDVCRMVIDFDRWTPEATTWIWDYITKNWPLDEEWHNQMHGMLVQLMDTQIQQDMDFARQGKFAHITQAMAR